MRSFRSVWPFAVILGLLFEGGVARATTVNASSCQLADVEAAVTSASTGDTVVIPAGSCTWNGTLSITKPITLTGSGTPNTSASTFGAGTTSTVLTDNSGYNPNAESSNPLISVSGLTAGETVRVSLLDIEPTPGTTVGWPIVITGKCSSSGCPSFRLDNIVWGMTTPWTYVPLLTQTLVSVDNIFGVVDHNTVMPASANDHSPEFANINLTSYQGVGLFGDNSWASPDSFGTNEAVFLENNDISSNSVVTENEFPAGQSQGGGRVVGRFNHLTADTGPFSYHGTETSGRGRSGRGAEIYGNDFNCLGNCNVYVGLRGGTAFVFGNTWTFATGAWLNNILNIETQRTWRATSWSQCNGLTPYDDNDGYAQVGTGTIGSISGTNPYTITVSGSSWTADAFDFSASTPGSKFYIVWDSTAGWMGGIASNTASSVTTNFAIPSTPGSATAMSVGDTITVYSSTLYAAGTNTAPSGATTLTDSTKNWTPNQWAGTNHGYSVINLTQSGLSNQISASTSNTLTLATPSCCPAWTWNENDTYIVAGYTQCLDQGGAGAGQLYANYIPTPVSATTEVIDPSYEWDNGGGPPLDHGNIGTDSPATFTANVQFYTDNSGGQPVECSASHACTSLMEGVAWGELAYRPTTCTAGVGYFATDQGSWNESGNAFGQGQLFVCGAGNTWTLHYAPYCYPHPLVSGMPCSSEAPDGGTLPDAGGVSADSGPAGDAASSPDGGAGKPGSSSGCGCRVIGTRSATGSEFGLGLLGGLALVRRRRRTKHAMSPRVRP